MKSELKELLTYFSSTNYGEGYVDKKTGVVGYNTGAKAQPITDAVIDEHLRGGTFLGVNTTLDKYGSTKAVVFDIDCKQDSDAARRDEYFAKITGALADDGVPYLTFVSGSGRGRHVFVLFSRAIQKSYARLFAKHYAEVIGIEVKDGVLELFPKHDGIDKVENIALPLARESKVIGEFKIVPFDPVRWKPTLTGFQQQLQETLTKAFAVGEDGKVHAYGAKVLSLGWNSAIGIDTINKANYAFMSKDGEHIYAVNILKDSKRANDARSTAKDLYGDLATALKDAPPTFEGLGFLLAPKDGLMTYVSSYAQTVTDRKKPGRKGKAQDNNAAFDCAAKMYKVDEYKAPLQKDGKEIDTGWLAFMMACYSAFKHDASLLAWVRGRFLDWSAQSPKYDKDKDPLKFDDEGPLSSTPPEVFWAKAIDGGYRGGSPLPKKDEKQSVIELILEGGEIFQDENRAFYMNVAPRKNFLLQSTAFAGHVRRLYYEASSKTLSADAINSVVATITAMHETAETKSIYMRSASHGDKSYLSLADDDCTVIEIDAHGYRICPNPPVQFVRSSLSQPLPMPDRTGCFDDFEPFYNFSKDEDARLLAFSWMIKTWLEPDSETPVLLFQGEAGSGKSVTSRNVVMLIDPQKAPLSTQPKDARDLLVAVRHSYVVAFDNLSSVYGDISDVLASIVTGGGTKDRQLFTNGELDSWEGMRPIILNGIDPTISKNDLVSRCVHINLWPFEGEFVDKKIITERFMTARPRLLHALLTLCSRVKAKLADVDEGAASRMVGYTRVGEALARIFGHEPGYFATMYTRLIKAEQDVNAKSHIVTQMMHRQLKKFDEAGLKEHEFDLVQTVHDWTREAKDLMLVGEIPKNASWLSRTMMELNTSGALSDENYKLIWEQTAKRNTWIAKRRTPFAGRTFEFMNEGLEKYAEELRRSDLP